MTELQAAAERYWTARRRLLEVDREREPDLLAQRMQAAAEAAMRYAVLLGPERKERR